MRVEKAFSIPEANRQIDVALLIKQIESFKKIKKSAPNAPHPYSGRNFDAKM